MVSEDKDYSSRDRKKFRLIVEISKKYWCHLYSNPYQNLAFGHLLAWEKRSVLFILSYVPDRGIIRVHGAVANQVEKKDLLNELLKIYNSAHRNINVRLDTEYLTVFVDSKGQFPVYEDKLPEELDTIYKNLKLSINNKLLHNMLEYVNAHFLGTPIDLWDYE
jgi:hypothetical protein